MAIAPSSRDTGRRSRQIKRAFTTAKLFFLNPAGVAIGAGEFGVLGIDVHEVMSFRIYLLEFFAPALGKNQVT